MKLFNDEIEDKGDPQEWYIRQKDAVTLHARVSRLKYLHKINPEGRTLMGSVETVNGYREMQWCYIEGFYLSVIVLAQSIIEKILQDRLYQTPGVVDKDIRTLSSMLKVIKKKGLLNDFWVTKIDRIRRIRNPITHLRETGDKDCADLRSYLQGNNIERQLELAQRMHLKLPLISLCHA